MGKGGPETNSSQFEPTDFDAVAAGVILRPLMDAGIAPDFRLSHPNIVCNRLESPKGTVITVVNLGHQRRGPAKEVTLEATGLSAPAKVWSYAYPKGLPQTFKDGTLTIQLPTLGLTDIVVVEATP